MSNKYRTVYENADGLSVFLGVGESYSGNAGEYYTNGSKRQIAVIIPDMTKLVVLSTTASLILDDTVLLPKGAVIESVETMCYTTATGSSSTFNLGIMNQDRATAISGGDNGLIAAMPITSYITAGDLNTHVVGSTYAGTLIGTALTIDGLLVGSWSTAVFTAGYLECRINYSFPIAATA